MTPIAERFCLVSVAFGLTHIAEDIHLIKNAGVGLAAPAKGVRMKDAMKGIH